MLSFWLAGTLVVAIATILSLLVAGIYLYVFYGLTADELIAWKPTLISKRPLAWLVASLTFVSGFMSEFPRIHLRSSTGVSHPRI
jgi:hypothetical protein